MRKDGANKDVQPYIQAGQGGNPAVHWEDGAAPNDRRRLFKKLQALILDLYPRAEIVISYQIPTYKVKSGWVGLGYWRDGVSLYTNGSHHIEEFKARYPAIKTGKGCLNFRVTDAVPIPALKKVIRRAIEHPRPT
jgi:uncharacterized protein YdhG (YjbR/CyaY superfamily)